MTPPPCKRCGAETIVTGPVEYRFTDDRSKSFKAYNVVCGGTPRHVYLFAPAQIPVPMPVPHWYLLSVPRSARPRRTRGAA